MKELMNFEKIAPFLEDPLVLIGFFLFLGFLFVRVLVVKGIIRPLNQKQGFSILKQILLYGFVFGILLMVLGFGLKYREMNKIEQITLVKQLSKELQKNLLTVDEVKLNTEFFAKRIKETSQIIRTPGIDLLVIMFPDVNLNLDTTINTIVLANNSFDYIVNNNLHLDELQMNKLRAAGAQIVSTIETITTSLNTLADIDNSRYKIETQIWTANLRVYRKISIVDITEFQELYNEMDHLRAQYSVVAENSIQFLFSIEEFFRPKSNKLTRENLSKILSKERHTHEILIDFSEEIANCITRINNLNDKLESITNKATF